MPRMLTAKQLRAEIPHVTRFCAEMIRKSSDPEVDAGTKTRSNLRPMNANELYQAAVHMTVKLVDVHEAQVNGAHDETALLSPDEIAAAMSLIAIAKAATERGRNRKIIHELATEIQKSNVAQDMYGVETVECPGQNGHKIRHQIARRVEDALCGAEPQNFSEIPEWEEPVRELS